MHGAHQSKKNDFVMIFVCIIYDSGVRSMHACRILTARDRSCYGFVAWPACRHVPLPYACGSEWRRRLCHRTQQLFLAAIHIRQTISRRRSTTLTRCDLNHDELKLTMHVADLFTFPARTAWVTEEGTDVHAKLPATYSVAAIRTSTPKY